MNEKDLKKLADLARIAVSDSELKKLHKDMEAILKHVSHVQKVTTGHEEKISTEGDVLLREDTGSHESGMYTKELLQEAPKLKDGCIEVKKIISV